MKNIYSILILLMVTLNLFGQENFYWSGGKKHILNEVENKYVVKLSPELSPQQARQELNENRNITLVGELRETVEIIIAGQMLLADIKKQPGIIDAMPAFSLNKEMVYMTGEILLEPQDSMDINHIISLVNNEVEVTQRSKYNTFVLEVNNWGKLFEYANKI